MMDASMDIRGGRITRDIRLAEDIGRTGTVSGLVRGTGELMRRRYIGGDSIDRKVIGSRVGMRETPEPMERAAGRPEITSRSRDIAPRKPQLRIMDRRKLADREPTRREPQPREPARRMPGRRTPEPRDPASRLPGGRMRELRVPTPRGPVVRVPPVRVTPVRVTTERVPPVRVSSTRTPPMREPDMRVPDQRYRAAWISSRDLDKVPKSERRSITGWRQGFTIKILNTETGELWHVPEDEKPDWVRVARGVYSAYRSFSTKGGPIPSYVVPMGAQRVYVTNKGLKFRPNSARSR